MSAAAVLAIRIKRIFAYLRKRGAYSPDTAIPISEAPHSDRWYFRRLIRSGAVKTHEGKCYLDEEAAARYLRRRRIRIIVCVIVLLVLWALVVLLAG